MGLAAVEFADGVDGVADAAHLAFDVADFDVIAQVVEGEPAHFETELEIGEIFCEGVSKVGYDENPGKVPAQEGVVTGQYVAVVRRVKASAEYACGTLGVHAGAVFRPSWQ